MRIANSIPFHAGNLSWLLHDLLGGFPWDPVEAIADFDLIEKAKRSHYRPARPEWRLYDRHRNKINVPLVNYAPHDYATLEEIMRHARIEPLYDTMRRIHLRRDGIFVAPLVDGSPGAWSFIHAETLTAHEILECAARFQRDHGEP